MVAIQWDLSKTNTLETKMLVLISKEFLIFKERIIYIKLGTWSGVLLNRRPYLFQRCPN